MYLAERPPPSAAEREAAWLYTLVHRGNPGDVAFYVEVCRGAERVLELGCGAGRVLVEIAAVASQITGLDLDPAALERATRALPEGLCAGPGGVDRVRWVAADMRCFDLGVRFDRIVIPYNGLYVLLTEADRLACLRSVCAHLHPRGRLYLDGYCVGDDVDLIEAMATPLPFEHIATVTEGARRVEIFDRERLGEGPDRIDVDYRFRVVEGGESRWRTQTIRHGFVRPARLPALLERAGLRLVARWGGFRREPFGEESAHMVIEAAPMRTSHT